ncbi:TPA: ADP-ribosyltransferase [Clostridioides difficile]
MANKFNKAMKNAERARDISSNRTTKKIRKLYKDIANEYAKKLNRVNSNTLTEQYLRESIIYLNKEYDRLGKKLKKDIESEISKVIKTTTDEQLSFFNNICDNYSVNLKPQFIDMFSKVHEDVLRQVISGSMYKDKLKLSDRIWSNIDKTKKDLDYIVSRGLAEKRGSYDIAKDLEKYVNPKVKKDYDWSKVYPKSNKKIDFNAYRLASTYITHAYQKTAKESCRKNPFVKGIKWMSSHHSRMCKVCADRNGKTYIPEELPLEHPLGKCTFEYDIPMSMEDIGKELRSWIDGEENSKLDEWFDEYGLDFAGIEGKVNKNKEPTEDEMLALYKYMGGDAYKINEKLRRNIKLTEEDEWFINNLDKVLDKMPNYEGDVTRSLYFYNKESLIEFLESHELRKVKEYKEFLSTTKGETYNPNAQVEIYILDSKKGKNISMYNDKEKEILYERNSKFEVMEIEEINGKYFILLEERDE